MKSIALVGATGNVGRHLIKLLLQRQSLDPKLFRLLSSKRSAGQTIEIENHSFAVGDLSNYDFKNTTLAIFSTDSDISKQYIPKALAAGATVIDSSSAFRMDKTVPLIVPPVNLDLVTQESTLIATANCLACPIAIVLNPLFKRYGLKRVLVSTYQSTSGAGKAAMDELNLQTRAHYEGRSLEPVCFARPIAFNVIPQVDRFAENGFSYEEIKIQQEVQKIISPTLKIAATTVRVPVFIGHSISLSVDLEKPFTLEEVKTCLSQSPGIQISPDQYSTPLEVTGQDEAHIGRFRKDPTVPNGLLLWLASDNLRRGAALDVVEIAEKIMKLL